MYPWTCITDAPKIDEVRLYRFSLPYRRPLAGEKQREGYLVRCRRGRYFGWGEISPWPGLHDETQQTLSQFLPSYLSQHLSRWVPEFVCSAALSDQMHSANTSNPRDNETRSWLQAVSPLISWGLVSASLQLLAAERGHSLVRLFRAREPVPVRCAALVLEEQDFCADDFSSYSAIKVKARRPDDISLLTRVRDALPHIEIRADGNRALSFDEARRMIESTQAQRVRFFEEPAPPEVLLQLIEGGAKIALDEYLSTPELSSPLLQAACLWVLKPSVLGPFRTFSLLQAGHPVVLSSPFESGVGRHVLAQLQSAFAPTEAAGLGVARYFAADLIAGETVLPVLSCETPLEVDEARLTELGAWGNA